jgi:uncharacterized protein YndB with AHSA1/START domain
MRPYREVTLDWIATAPLRLRTSARFATSPARVFDALADAAGWPRWFPLMTAACWLRGAPGGIDAVREVSVLGFGRFEERFVAWEPGARFGFTMIAGSSPLAAAIAEDYRLTPDGDGTRLAWTFGAEPTALGRLAAPALRLAMPRIVDRATARLARRL